MPRLEQGIVESVVQVPMTQCALDLLEGAGASFGVDWNERGGRANIVRSLLASCPAVLQVAKQQYGMSPEDVQACFTVQWGVHNLTS